MVDENDIPENWSWGIGEASDSYYDYWAYQEENEYELHMWWDEGKEHKVEIIPVLDITKDGRRYGTAKETCGFKSEQEALKYAIELMQEY